MKLDLKTIILLLRLSLGFIFLWAFLDKLLGLGFATEASKSWLNGVSPTTGFLKFGTHGMFKPFFEVLAGNMYVDLLFMGGLLLLGISLILGIGLRLATYGGSILMILLWLSRFPPENNPILDEHIIYALVLLFFGTTKEKRLLSIHEWWRKTPLVKKLSWLE